jgi:hypothetical protein
MFLQGDRMPLVVAIADNFYTKRNCIQNGINDENQY